MSERITPETGAAGAPDGLRGRLLRWLAGEWLREQGRLERELIATQAALAGLVAESAEVRRRFDALAGTLRAEQEEDAERLRKEMLEGRAELARQLTAAQTRMNEQASAVLARLAEQARRFDEETTRAARREAELAEALRAGLAEQDQRGEQRVAGALSQAAQARAALQDQLDRYGIILEDRSKQNLAHVERQRVSLQEQLDTYGRLLRESTEQSLERDEGARASIQQQVLALDRSFNEAGGVWREQHARITETLQAHQARFAQFAQAQQQVGEAREQLEAALGRLGRIGLEIDAARARRDELQSEGFQRIETGLGRLDGDLDALRDPVGPGFGYTAFEDRFRGSEELIRERQAIYLPQFKKRGPVLDLGCGRGELLGLLKSAGIPAQGVEYNPEQVARCRKRGLEVVQDDFLRWLPAQPDRKFGAVVALQVVEHLTLRELRAMIGECARILKPGGLLLFETVNPHCGEAMEWFYIDPTHVRPVYPEMLEFLFEQAGFAESQVRYQIPCTGAAAGEPPTSATGADYAIWGVKR